MGAILYTNPVLVVDGRIVGEIRRRGGDWSKVPAGWPGGFDPIEWMWRPAGEKRWRGPVKSRKEAVAALAAM